MSAVTRPLASPSWFVGEGDSPVRVNKWTAEDGSSVSIWLDQHGLKYLWRKPDGTKMRHFVHSENIPETCKLLQRSFPLISGDHISFVPGIQSVMKKTAIIRPQDGAITMISQGSSRRACTHITQRNAFKASFEGVCNSFNASMSFLGHAGLVVEWMEGFNFYRRQFHLVNSDLVTQLALVKESIFDMTNLENVHSQSSTFILEMNRVRELVQQARKDIAKTKDDVEKIILFKEANKNEEIPGVMQNAFKFDMTNPHPERLVINCIAYSFELLKAAGIDLSPLYDEKILIPRADVQPLDKLIKRAIKHAYKNIPQVEYEGGGGNDKRVIALRKQQEDSYTQIDKFVHEFVESGLAEMTTCVNKCTNPENWTKDPEGSLDAFLKSSGIIWAAMVIGIPVMLYELHLINRKVSFNTKIEAALRIVKTERVILKQLHINALK